MELAAVREEPADLMVGGLAGGAGVAEGDQQGVFLKLVGLGFQGERVVFAGLFGLFEGVGVEVLRCDVAGLRQGDTEGCEVTNQVHIYGNRKKMRQAQH
ncbi:hypothetical protein [Streptomyces sp. SAI-127]|uniref:hypothetical protein n=1 Tax=Streptomyces sp. SAI-127 TaxID=2940543 RepID=UPI002476356B|nr:hypothetical protein [Streptomyces sp. SAI-127]MDH6493743.1 hypothetical protein [Streptomyces sp. SAI-127]